jgi:hypothetical protein
MAYVTGNPKSKAELRRRIAAGEAFKVYQPGPFGNNPCELGTFAVEGPHYPAPHRWYGLAKVNAAGLVESIK